MSEGTVAIKSRPCLLFTFTEEIMENTALKQKSAILRLVYSAVFLALAIILPLLTGNIQTIGKMLCPMHIPVLLCAFVCGPYWAAAVGFIAPLLRFLLFSMPPMPNGIAMAFELLTYGLICGLMYKLLPKKFGFTYLSLIIAMIAGRLIWGASMLIISGVTSKAFTFPAFWAGAVTGSVPGIILQIVLIPPLALLLEKLNVSKKA